MAQMLMHSLTEDFRLDDQHDHYRDADDEVVTARLAGQEPPHAPEPRSGPVLDLMAMLQKRPCCAGGTRYEQGHPREPGSGRRTG
ncbi:hypothetical protein ACPCUV_29695 [Streptomyces platensis]|uniref:hypothetical protein n=1 Tax=Streptomyces platensis TaxID=58346 RepID=UPI003C2B8439